MHDAVITEQRVVYEPTRWIKENFFGDFYPLLEENFSLQRAESYRDSQVSWSHALWGKNKH